MNVSYLRLLRIVLFGTTLLGMSPSAMSQSTTTVYQAKPLVPIRLQWHQNYGYCGETSFSTIGLSLGQYVPQYTMRALASPGLNQYDITSQLILGANDAKTANTVLYKYAEYSTCSQESKKFLTWIKSRLYEGRPVVIGIYLNEYLFYKNQVTSKLVCKYDPKRNTCPSPLNCTPTGRPGRPTSLNGTCQYGDPEYDHIVTVTQITTKKPCKGVCEYADEDTITFDDHGLYDSECDYGNDALNCPITSKQRNLCTPQKTANYRYLYTYTFKEFQKSRTDANAPNGPVYSLNSTPVKGAKCTGNYGIAIRGIQGKDLLPINISINDNFECDMIMEDSNNYYPISGRGPVVHQTIELTVTVSNMAEGKQYNLYQYDSFSDVPPSNFNQNSNKASHRWVIKSLTGSASKVVNIPNNKTAIFRAVSVDAP